MANRAGCVDSALWWFAMLVCAGCAAKPAEEACNGIDDTGDGRIDEGCPCTAFVVDVPFRVHSAVSLGDGWALVTNELTARQTVDAHASYTRIDDTGSVVAMQLLDGVAWGGRHQFAWNGSEIAYVAGDPDGVHVAFLSGEGVKTRNGLPIAISHVSPFPSLPHGMIASTPGGYNLLVSAPAGSGAPIAYFASTDRAGAPQAATLQAPGGAGSRAFALGSLGGSAAVGWTPIQGGGLTYDRAYAGPPFSQDHPIDTNQLLGPYSFDSGDGDGDGTMMAFILPRVVVSFDGAHAVSKTLTGPEAIAWTGDVFEVAAIGSDQNSVTAGEVGLTRELSILPQRTIFPDTVKGDLLINAPALASVMVAADARRALFGFFYTVNGVGHQALSQVCL
jgi:hypothetical protein